ncbi:hypothetical protein LTR53_014826, partial [Teratosphaeriaceae sp. CCFEE 6253]
NFTHDPAEAMRELMSRPGSGVRSEQDVQRPRIRAVSPRRYEWESPRLNNTFQRDDMFRERWSDYYEGSRDRTSFSSRRSPSPTRRPHIGRRSISPPARQSFYDHYDRQRMYSDDRRIQPASHSSPSLTRPVPARGDGSSPANPARDPRFRNLTWTSATNARPAIDTAPYPVFSGGHSGSPSRSVTSSLPQRPPGSPTTADFTSPTAASKRPLQAAAKVDFDGLKSVPTGPRPVEGTRGPPPSSKHLSDVDRATKAAPHIFIPSISVPPRPTTIRHLARFLSPPVNRDDVFIDDTGYYIIWPDTEQGHRQLHACFAKNNGSTFFSKYVILMAAFHEGQPAAKVAVTPSLNDLEQAPSVAAAHKRLREVTTQEATPVPASRTTDMASNLARRFSIRSSSPLYVPSRQDRDDASSVSGRTGTSELSASSKLKCHVCKQPAKAGAHPPVKCSTCVRRYHDACHPLPRVPRPSESHHQWQCRRCVKKRIDPRTPRSGTPAESGRQSLSLTLPVPGPTGPEERPAKRQRLEEQGKEAPVGVVNVLHGDGTPGSTTTNRGRADQQPPALIKQGTRLAADESMPTPIVRAELPAQRTGGTLSDDLDKLVEESFATLPAQQIDMPRRQEKLKLVRTKIVKPAQTTDAVDADKTSGGPGAQPQAAISRTMAIQPTRVSSALLAPSLLAAGLTAAVPRPAKPAGLCTETRREPEVPESPEITKGSRLQSVAAVTKDVDLGPASPADSVLQKEQGRAKRTKEKKMDLLKCRRCRKSSIWARPGSGHSLCQKCIRQQATEGQDKVHGLGEDTKLAAKPPEKQLEPVHPGVIRAPAFPINPVGTALATKPPEKQLAPVHPGVTRAPASPINPVGTALATKPAEKKLAPIHPGMTRAPASPINPVGKPLRAGGDGEAIAAPAVAAEQSDGPKSNTAPVTRIGDAETSDDGDEPLTAPSRRGARAAALREKDRSPVRKNVAEPDPVPAGVEHSISAPAQDCRVTSAPAQDCGVSLLFKDLGHPNTTSLALLVKLEAEKIKYTARSLFEEWPEYDPKNRLDVPAKTEEIKKRPTRKQMFGKAAMYSRLGGTVTCANSDTADDEKRVGDQGDDGTLGRRTRSPKKPVSYAALPALEEAVHEVKTMEEFFGLPCKPIPVVHKGQLAYRDGTRDVKGRLPRAGVFYNTGYD